MGALTDATLVAEQVLSMKHGMLPAVRVIPHNDDGTKPRGKAGKGLLIVAKEGQAVSDLLRTVAGFYEQEGSWSAFTVEQVAS